MGLTGEKDFILGGLVGSGDLFDCAVRVDGVDLTARAKGGDPAFGQDNPDRMASGELFVGAVQSVLAGRAVLLELGFCDGVGGLFAIVCHIDGGVCVRADSI